MRNCSVSEPRRSSCKPEVFRGFVPGTVTPLRKQCRGSRPNAGVHRLKSQRWSALLFELLSDAIIPSHSGPHAPRRSADLSNSGCSGVQTALIDGGIDASFISDPDGLNGLTWIAGKIRSRNLKTGYSISLDISVPNAMLPEKQTTHSVTGPILMWKTCHRSTGVPAIISSCQR